QNLTFLPQGRSKTAEPKDRAATDQTQRRSRTQIYPRLTTLAISEDIRGVACGSHRRLLFSNSPAVHPSTNTSPYAPRSAVVFPRIQHRTATGQSDRILLLESIKTNPSRQASPCCHNSNHKSQAEAFSIGYPCHWNINLSISLTFALRELRAPPLFGHKA
ncbi:hypothetical protein D6D13_09049, partial [Aureobasidium pullulans]